MTKIEWDKVGERTFEAGVNRGVLYLPDGSAVPWNGLRSVDETPASGGLLPLFLDGIRIADRQITTDFSAKIKAFTYPSEFEALTGQPTYGSGLQVDGQRSKRFGLSYRTGVGSDTDTSVSGGKIHLVYNALAIPSSRSYSSIAENTAPNDFEWDISTKPVQLVGFRPTAHFVVNTTTASPDAVVDFENLLYGTATTEPKMPKHLDLLTIFADGPVPSSVIDADGGWTMSGPDQFFNLTENNTAFEVRNVKTTSADEDEYTMESD